MLLYKFIFKEIIISFVLSIIILSTVLYIFSIIELLNNSYIFSKTLILGLINTLELIITIPTIVFVMSIILFWNNIKKANELIIIRHYLSIKKIIIIFSTFVILMSYLEINKSNLNNKIIDIKENFLKKSNQNKTYQKNFYQFEDNRITITRINGLNVSNNTIKEVSVYKFDKNLFINSLYSEINEIKDENIILINPKIITSRSINDLGSNYKINLKTFGENVYNEKINIKILKNKKSSNKTELLKITTLVIVLYTYLSIFLSKEGVQKNASVLKYSFLAFIIFTYAFISSQIYLVNYNFIFHLSVLLTFAFYLYKNLMNE